MGQPAPQPQAVGRLLALLEQIALRVAAWGGALALVVLFLGDLRTVVLPGRSAPAPSAPGEPEGEGPGWPHLRGPTYDALSGELRRWYAASMAALGGAALLAGLVFLAMLPWRAGAARPASRAAFWTAALALGLGATPLANRFSPEFVFTWPLALSLAELLALAALLGLRRVRARRAARWASVAVGLAFLAVCLAYFDLCRRLDLSTSWVFLIGLASSWPLALPAAARTRGGQPFGRDLAWAAGVFTLYFWSVGAYVAWLGRGG